MLLGCLTREHSIIYNCSFVPVPLKNLTGNELISESDAARAALNDPVHNVAGVMTCDF